MSPDEYRVVLTEQTATVYRADGSTPEYSEVTMLRMKLEEVYGRRSYLYVCEGDNGYKIGVSCDPDRRERELNGIMIHLIECLESRIWQIEKDVHKIFGQWRMRGEWFDFGADRKRFEEVFFSLKTEKELRTWIREILHPEITKRHFAEFAFAAFSAVIDRDSPSPILLIAPPDDANPRGT